jgi:hypothetical protein
MYKPRSRIGIPLFLLFASLLARSSSAQAPLEPAQLPARTTFYFIWHGSPSGDVRKANALVSLWDDPDFAPVRVALFDAMMSDAKKQNGNPGLSREEIAQFATLLDNPFTIGYLPRRETPAAKTASAAEHGEAQSAKPSWNGMFFVYDRSGKEALLSRAVLRARSAETDIPKLTEITVEGIKALKVERKSSTTYWAETGKYAASANNPIVFEEVLRRLSGKSAGGSLADSEAYQEARPVLSGGVMEFFLRVPQVKDLAADADAAPSQWKPFFNSIRLDTVHVLAGHLSLDGVRTHMQGAILGETSEGSLFDIWPAGQSRPASLAYVTPETVYYNESQIDLLGIYNILKRALAQPGSNSAGLAATLENAAQTRIGMTLPEAFALTSGEFGTLQTSPSLDPDKKLFFVGIRNKPDALKLMHTIFSDQITAERNEGTVTYLKISLQGSQGARGVAQWNFYHLAMTPDLLLGATKGDALRAVVAHPPASDGASFPKNLQAARGQFPGTLNGFTYFDLQKLDWPALQQSWAAQAAKTAADAKTPDEQQKAKKVADWLANVNPEVFPRHLHVVTGASWKDASGLHFDEWLD